MKTVKTAAVAALMSCVGTAEAQTRVQACISPPAAEALMLVIAPDALRKVAEVCAPVLPAGALLRRSPNPLIARYVAESDAAWNAARGAIGAIAGAEASALLDSDLARPLITTVVGAELTKQIKPRDCGAIDRILGLLEPLPPRNAAALVVTLAQLSQKPGKKAALNICTDAARQ